VENLSDPKIVTGNQVAEGPFVGRTNELALLKTAVDSARTGQFSAVLVSGESGIGKSRLAAEVCEYARSIGFEVAAGRACKTQSASHYSLFVEALRHLGWDFRRNRGKRPRARRHPPGFALVAARLGVNASRPVHVEPGNINAAEADLFASVGRLLAARSHSGPMLLLFEDVDLADAGSLSLLAYLVRVLARAHLLILATCGQREDREEVREALAECVRHRCCRRLRLKGLSGEEIVRLAEQLLGAKMAVHAARLGPELARLSNGNPRFIERIVRYLLEASSTRIGNQAEVTLRWDSRLAAEEDLREAVDARLSGLSRRCQEILSAAAVLGDEFEFDVLAKMLQLGASELTEVLGEATRAGILTDGRNDRTDYVFAHALVQQSLYERHNRPAKRALHAQAARAIEAVHCADLASQVQQLALHYTRAATAGDLAKAVTYCMRAGQTAYGAGAYADAIRHWQAALRLVSDDERKLRAQLAELLGEASVRAATLTEAVRYLQSAWKLYKELGESAGAARIQARLFTVLSLRHVGQAVPLLTMSHMAACKVPRGTVASTPPVAVGDPGAEAEMQIGAAVVAHAQFRTEDGLAASGRAMELAQQLDDPGVWCQAAALNGHFLLATGRVRQGMTLMERATDRAMSTRDPKPGLAAAWLLSFSCLLLWDPGAAEEAIETALAAVNSEQVDFLRQVLFAHLGIAQVFTTQLGPARSILTSTGHRFLEANLRLLEGEWSEAEMLLKEQLERARAADSAQQHWIASFWLARLKRITGDDHSALELVKQTPLIAQSLLRVPEEITTRSELALLRLARGELAEARSEVCRCRTLLTPTEDWRGLSGFVARAEAALLTQEGKLEEAQEFWQKAERVFSEYRLTWELAETLVICGTLLSRQGKTDAGVGKLNAAVEMYRSLKLGNRWEERVRSLFEPFESGSLGHFGESPSPALRNTSEKQLQTSGASTAVSQMASAHDLALLATLIHDAIAHLMNAIDKASKMRVPIERIAEATERISTIDTSVERLARALEQVALCPVSSAPNRGLQRARPSRANQHKLSRSHDPGRPLGSTKLS
jgi:tetratricopeptide (TPR) repeat protein